MESEAKPLWRSPHSSKRGYCSHFSFSANTLEWRISDLPPDFYPVRCYSNWASTSWSTTSDKGSKGKNQSVLSGSLCCCMWTCWSLYFPRKSSLPWLPLDAPLPRSYGPLQMLVWLLFSLRPFENRCSFGVYCQVSSVSHRSFPSITLPNVLPGHTEKVCSAR